MPSHTAIPELTPRQAHERQSAGAVLVDIREDGERAAGMPEGALGVSQSKLEADPSAWLPERGEDIILVCAIGAASLQCGATLQRLGYTRLASVEGGILGWEAFELPMSAPTADPAFLERYSRHLLLAQVGLDGQRKLEAARVALIGAGGLGSPAALYLAAAGIGHITLIDNDTVELSNLQRQVLHRNEDVGQAKVDSGHRSMKAICPDLHVNSVNVRLGRDNVHALLQGHDVVIDGSDNFTTRYLANDACVKLGIPLVYGAVQEFEGQLSVFWPQGGDGGCYRCLFPEPPPTALAPNCAQAGVLGVLPGVIGTLQATEAIKLILGIGQPLYGTLLRFDALGMAFDRVVFSRDASCACCANRARRAVQSAAR